MKVLVTGGAGFISSHIVHALVEQGHQVVVVDNLATSFLENINPGARFYKMSFMMQSLLAFLSGKDRKKLGIRQVRIFVARSVNEPIFDTQENVLSNLNVILNFVRFAVKRIICASSDGAV